MLSAFVLGLLTSLGVVAVWHVMMLALMSGFASAFDMPVRQSVVPTLVGKHHIMNAIALNSTAFNSARIIGPALAGILVTSIGLGKCFYVNSASYLAFIAAIAMIRIETFRPSSSSRASGLIFDRACAMSPATRRFAVSCAWRRCQLVRHAVCHADAGLCQRVALGVGFAGPDG